MAVDTTTPISKVIVNGTEVPLAAGGGNDGDSGGEYLVRVIDYDGTVLKSDHLDIGATFTLPDAPTNHERLVFQEWSSPVTITDNTITVGNSDITIGAVYTTASGLSEFDITLTKVTGLDVTLNMDGTKNWGDGTSDTATTHTYSDYGDYTITCDGTTMTTAPLSGLFGQSSSAKNYYCKNARFADVTSIGYYAFQYCYSLTSVTIPSGVTSIGDATYSSRVFHYCSSLPSITIPNGVTSIGRSDYYYCYSLTSVAIPNGVTSIGEDAFGVCNSLTSITIPDSVTSIGYYVLALCYSLKNITIPAGVTMIKDGSFYKCYSLKNLKISDSVTSIGNDVFSDCNSLTSIKIPAGVTSIFGNVFSSCYSLTKYDMTTLTAVPTLTNTSAFNSINAACKIYVPDALYDEWIVATNWSTYADYIYKASEMED